MSESKPILAIETSGKSCGVCLYFNEEKLFEQEMVLKHAHSDRLFDIIDSVLKFASTEIKDLKCIAVSSGPGSFTGLRIGMSAAKGLALGAELPIVPVPTFEALALQMSRFIQADSEFAVASKVNSEELYYARFKVKPNSYIFVHNLAVIKKEELKNLVENILVVGDFHEYKIQVPSARFIAVWCELFGSDLLTFNYDFIEPNYLKNFIVKGK
jgi:tRNA threonylcarbamoyladenosine biosynthesis protein TsaB